RIRAIMEKFEFVQICTSAGAQQSNSVHLEIMIFLSPNLIRVFLELAAISSPPFAISRSLMSENKTEC
ncbi:MAG: hypothetical protein ABI230_08250, partial [Aestuariivirga sp.]